MFLSHRERWLWAAAGLYIAAIYSTLGVVRPLTDWLRDRGLLRATISALFVVTLVVLGSLWLRHRPRWPEWLVLAVAAGAYAAVFPFFVAPEERLHLLEYGGLGALLYYALGERARCHREAAATPGLALRWRPFTTILSTTALGWLDEGIQGLLPSRHYDLRDVAFNALAGGLAVLSLAALAGVRSWSQQQENSGGGERPRGKDAPLPPR